MIRYTPHELAVAQRVAQQAHKAQLDLILHTANRPMNPAEIALHARFMAIEAAALWRIEAMKIPVLLDVVSQ